MARRRLGWSLTLVLAAGGCSDDGSSRDGFPITSTSGPGLGSDSTGGGGTPPTDSSGDGDATGMGDGDGGATGPGATSSSADGSTSGGMTSTICDDVAGAPLIPPATCDGPAGNTSTEVPPNGLFSTSWFGCYEQDDGTIYMDPFDNCEFACGSQGLCPAGQDGPTCEATLRWFAADADRYGCGGRIRVTNCENGNAVVLVTLDRGPNCNSVEMPCETPVLDMSHDAMVYLFDGGTFGGCELQTVVVEPVDDSTPLGPV